MMKITDLDHVCSLQERVKADDGYGNKRGDFQEVFRDWGGFRFLRGGEGVIESRLASKQPAILTLRSTAQAKTIAPHWRVVAGGRAYDVKEHPRPTDDRMFLEILVEAVPVGG
jgi:head-tail adaptor